MFRIGLGVGRPLPSFGAFDSDAQAFLSAAGITGATETDAVNTLVTSLKGYGIWSKMKAVYPFVTDNRNLLGYTNNWTNAIWQGSSVTTGQADPFGGTNAILCSVEKWQSFSYTTLTQYTISIYAKANTSSIFTLGSDSATGFFSTFNLSNQTVVNSTGYSGLITNVGNGWYRCSVTWTKDSGGASTNPYYDFQPSGGSMYFYGPQLELGSTATTYQPITTTQQSYISSQFKYNLKDPRDLDAAFRLVFNGGWTHSSTGATPNGTNGYADTWFNPITQLSSNSNFHLSNYSPIHSTGTSRTYIGSTSGASGTFNSTSIGLYNGGSIEVGQVSSLTSAEYGGQISAFGGMQNVSVNGSRVNKYYKNGVLSGVQTTGTGVFDNVNIYLAASVISGSLGLYDDKEHRFNSIGDGLSDTEASNLYTAVQAFQNSLNRAIAP